MTIWKILPRVVRTFTAKQQGPKSSYGCTATTAAPVGGSRNIHSTPKQHNGGQVPRTFLTTIMFTNACLYLLQVFMFKHQSSRELKEQLTAAEDIEPNNH